MEKKLIHTDEKTYNDLLIKGRQAKLAIEQLKEEWDKLDLGTVFSDTVFRHILSNGMTYIASLYNEGQEKQLDKLKIMNPIMRQNMLAGSEAVLKPISAAVAKVQKTVEPNLTTAGFDLNYICIGPGKVEVLEAELLETCQTYIETAAEYSLYNKLEALRTAFNETLKEVQQAGYTDYGKRNALEFFVEQEDKTLELQPGIISWVLNYRRKQEEQSERFNRNLNRASAILTYSAINIDSIYQPTRKIGA